MASGVAFVMSPASVFVTAARRSARGLARASGGLPGGTHRVHSGRRARVVVALQGLASSRHGEVHTRGCMSDFRGSIRAARSVVVGRAVDEAAARAAAEAALNEPSPAEGSSAACGEDDEAAFPRVPPSVHSCEGPLAVLQGISGELAPGTVLRVGTSTGILLSHREPKSFALIYDDGKGAGGAPAVGQSAAAAPGDPVEASEDVFRMPRESELIGRWIGALGEPLDGEPAPGGIDRDVCAGPGAPLMREPPSVEDRKPITTPLITGVKTIDCLTPVGRGQCMLVTGETGTGLSQLGVSSVVAQVGRGVRCVYGAVGSAAADGGKAVVDALEAAGAMAHSTVVACGPDASLAERYATTAAAFAVAEGAMAEGKDVMLVLDDFTGLIGFSTEMGRLSPQLVDAGPGGEDEEKMVEYEGMIINALLAERRRFLGMTLQRVARLNDKLGGGSLTLLGIMYHQKGAYKGKKGSLKESGTVGAAGEGVAAAVPGLPAGFDDMSKEMQAKITAALEKRKAAAALEAERAATEKTPEDDYVQPRSIVEEFMSITDGQVMVESFSPENGWGISVKDSVSRIGLPGAAGPLKSLDMMQVRLDVMQADDMGAFGLTGEEKDKMKNRSAAIRGMLRQKPGEPVSLSAQTVGMFALQKGFLIEMDAEAAAAAVAAAVERARSEIPEVMEALDEKPGAKLSEKTAEKLSALFA